MGSYDKRLLKATIDGNQKPVKKTIRKALSESQIQQSCLTWFKQQYPKIWSAGVLFHIANEGIRLGGVGSRMKREGIVRGVADLCLAIPRHGYGALYIEMKRPGTYQSPEQKEWQKGIEYYGNKYVICRSLDEFMTTVKRYLSQL